MPGLSKQHEGLVDLMKLSDLRCGSNEVMTVCESREMQREMFLVSVCVCVIQCFLPKYKSKSNPKLESWLIYNFCFTLS